MPHPHQLEGMGEHEQMYLLIFQVPLALVFMVVEAEVQLQLGPLIQMAQQEQVEQVEVELELMMVVQELQEQLTRAVAVVAEEFMDRLILLGTVEQKIAH